MFNRSKMANKSYSTREVAKIALAYARVLDALTEPDYANCQGFNHAEFLEDEQKEKLAKYKGQFPRDVLMELIKIAPRKQRKNLRSLL